MINEVLHIHFFFNYIWIYGHGNKNKMDMKLFSYIHPSIITDAIPTFHPRAITLKSMCQQNIYCSC